MEHQARVDPVITELSNLAATEEGEIRDAVVNGLANVVWSAGKNMGEGSKSSALDLVSEAFADTNKGELDDSLLEQSHSALTILRFDRGLQRRHRPSRRRSRPPRRRLPNLHHRLLPPLDRPSSHSTLLRHPSGVDRPSARCLVRARCTEDGGEGAGQRGIRDGPDDCSAGEGGQGAVEGEEAVE
jgi:hypothetical protein